MTAEAQIAHYLKSFPDQISQTAQNLRKHIKKAWQPSKELVGNSTISLNIGFGYTGKAWDSFCAIIVYSKHINISFPSGAQLKDPQNLLQGKGSRVRHIRVDNVEDLESPEVQALFLQARNNSLPLDQEIDFDNLTCETIIKEIGGPKKRPKRI